MRGMIGYPCFVEEEWEYIADVAKHLEYCRASKTRARAGRFFNSSLATW